ncbi:MAG: hypothetical protein RIC35_08310 [Marinoscillum sp.]
MKKTFLLLVLGGTVLFTGCDKSEDGKKEELDPLTSEKNKELMQNIAIEFIDEMSALQQLEGVSALTSFGLINEYDDEEEDGRIDRSNSVIRISKSILGFVYRKASPVEFGYSAARIGQDDEEEDDFTSLQELFDENTGTFTWNFDTEEFDFTDNSSDKVIFKYPAEVDGTSNNATLTLSNYTSVVVSNPIDEDYEGDLPTSLDVTLAVDGSVSMSYGFEIDYNSEGVPESIDTDLTIGTFSLAVGITNTKTVVGAEVNFNNGSKTLIAVATSVNGDFSDAAIEDAEDSEDPTEVVTDGSFSFTLLDLKFSADLDFASLWDEVGDLELYYDPYDEEPRANLESNAKALEDALKEHGTLKATYVSTSKVAADVEFYTSVEEDEDYGDEWVQVGARMIFEDGSKVDVEDFLESGFDGLEDAINDLIDQINSDLDEDDWIEGVDFSDLG